MRHPLLPLAIHPFPPVISVERAEVMLLYEPPIKSQVSDDDMVCKVPVPESVLSRVLMIAERVTDGPTLLGLGKDVPWTML